MKNMSCVSGSDDDMELPPGFRFHPTDEELISCYLTPKVFDNVFSARAIGEVDLNKVEPWDLPWRAKMGEKEWYFFCVRDRKYPTGMRTNRATSAGYWKATGKDREIFKAKTLVGMKKTLVFYKGRAPRGEKTNWVMHEYRLEGKNMNNIPKNDKNEWVICRVFKKSSGGKKIHISGLLEAENGDENSTTSSSKMPPLMDISQRTQTLQADASSPHVPCFSNDQKPQNTPHSLHLPSSSSSKNSDFSTPDSFLDYTQFSGHGSGQDQSILKLLMGNNKLNINSGLMGLRPYDDQEFLMNSTSGPVDLDCLWNY